MSPPSSTIPTGATKKRRRKKASKPTEKDFDTFCANMPLMQKISAAFVCMGLRIMFFWMVVSAIINATPALFVEHITTCVSSITAQAVATPGALTAAVIGDAPFSLLATVLADAAAPLVSCVATLVDDVVFGGDAAVEFVHIAALVTLVSAVAFPAVSSKLAYAVPVVWLLTMPAAVGMAKSDFSVFAGVVSATASHCDDAAAAAVDFVSGVAGADTALSSALSEAWNVIEPHLTAVATSIVEFDVTAAPAALGDAAWSRPALRHTVIYAAAFALLCFIGRSVRIFAMITRELQKDMQSAMTTPVCSTRMILVRYFFVLFIVTAWFDALPTPLHDATYKCAHGLTSVVSSLTSIVHSAATATSHNNNGRGIGSTAAAAAGSTWYQLQATLSTFVHDIIAFATSSSASSSSSSSSKPSEALCAAFFAALQTSVSLLFSAEMFSVPFPFTLVKPLVGSIHRVLATSVLPGAGSMVASAAFLAASPLPTISATLGVRSNVTAATFGIGDVTAGGWQIFFMSLSAFAFAAMALPKLASRSLNVILPLMYALIHALSHMSSSSSSAAAAASSSFEWWQLAAPSHYATALLCALLLIASAWQPKYLRHVVHVNFEMMYLLAKHAIRLFNLLALPGMLGTYVAHHPAVSGDGADGLAFILTGSSARDRFFIVIGALCMGIGQSYRHSPFKLMPNWVPVFGSADALVYTSIIGVGASLVAFGIAALAVDVSRSGYF